MSADIVPFPLAKAAPAQPAFRLPAGAYYLALDTITRLDDLRERLRTERSLHSGTRRRLAGIAADAVDTLDAIFDRVERLP